ncbi:MAG: M56 family metallopeptidase [Gemmatimonadaceae bacterium]
MIVSWMLATLLFTACLAVAAAAAEPLASAAGRPIRWVWSAALAAAALWPALLFLATLVSPQLRDAAQMLPALQVVPEGATFLGESSRGAMDVAGPVLLALWALASLLLIARLVRAVVALRRLRARSEPRLLDGVPVLLTEGIGPATIGLRRPAVIVPRSILELDEPLRRLVLRHEREHCAARDPWLLLCAAVAVVLFPWNAALWFLARRLHLALEIDCDARVLAGGAEVDRYGQLLVLIAQRRGAIHLAPMLAAPPTHLERRITAMRTRLSRPSPLRLVAAGALLVVAVVAACSEGAPNGPLAQTRPTAESRAAAQPATVPGPYFEFQVEYAARQIPGTGKLRYPDDMRTANREGEVLAQFVIDEQGVPQASTLKVLKTSDAAFTRAVASALPKMRFEPARIAGRAVKQVVQEPFTFSLQRN